MVDAAIASGLIDTSDGLVTPTTIGSAIAAASRAGDYVFARRAILAQLIRTTHLSLLSMAYMSEPAIKVFIDPDVVQCLVELRLLDRNSDESREWWKALTQMAEIADDQHLKEMGNRAEEMTVYFERERLSSAGLDHLAAQVTWVSRVDESLGYDVISFAGPLHPVLDSSEEIQIEVKAYGNVHGRPRFFLTRNEWMTALEHSQTWVLYCWRAADLRRETPGAPYAVLSVEQLAPWVPQDAGDQGQWATCQVFLSD
ncbi:MAG: DUF3883 domain-containing protein [Coriobacteriia bacterium]